MEQQQQQGPTKFEAWVKEYGVGKLVDAMRARGPAVAVTYSAVYQWVRGEHEPRGPKVRALVEIGGGSITLADIYKHFEQKLDEKLLAGAGK